MSNTQVADLFNEIADLLELGDENPFRIRAYRRAALNIQNLSRDLSEIEDKKELTHIPGIGDDLADKIQEFLATGKMKFHEEMVKKVSPVLLEMLQIPGIGPKTARLLHQQLKIKTLDDLEAKARQHKISGIPGIKDKTEQNILEGIDLVRRHRERTPLGKALPLAKQIIAKLKATPEVHQIAYAGSLRRMRETVRDIDILITSAKPKKVMQVFSEMPVVDKILAKGETKSSVITEEGIQIDLRVVQPDEFGAALLYFTGSKAHNIKLRSLAKKQGFKINEYGVFLEKTGRRLAGKTEQECYGVLKLKYINPELREDRGEIEAALSAELPDLVTRSDIRGDFHSHSNWSDGNHEIKEVVQKAKEVGLEYLVLTDHSQSLKVAGGLTVKEIFEQIEVIQNLNRKLRGFTLLCGSEVDILSDGALDFSDRVLERLDFVVASVHTGFKQSSKQLTSRIIRAMKNRYVNLIAHPTGRLMGERDSYEVDLEEIFKVARETNTALEINSYPGRLDLNDVHVQRARELGVPLAISTDAHTLDQFENLEYGVAVARRGWCERKNLLNCLALEALRKKIPK